MSDPSHQRSPAWFRFRLRTLLVAVAVVAIALLVAFRLYDHFTSVPLADAVAAFNAKSAADSVGKHEPPLTEDEIVAAIEAQLPNLDATDEVKSVYARIARKRRLPKDASLSSVSAYSSSYGDGLGQRVTVWWIDLDIMIDASSGYTLRIRRTDQPVSSGQGALK